MAAQALSGARAAATLEGGAAGCVYRVTNRIELDAGRADARSLVVRVDAMIGEVLTPPAAAVAIAELRAFLRIEGGGHADADAELAGTIRTATAYCEAF